MTTGIPTDPQALAQGLRENISRVIVGKDPEIELVMAALMSRGHVLIEDVPGTGKTLLAKSLARSIDAEFRRIQFTPDLLPSDLTGMHVFDQRSGEFVFRPGPVFTQILLADEINRASPRTQSSLLECMEERQVTIDGQTRPLTEPFFVLATQNPVETSGTYPLPEAQLDRFFIQLPLGYPDREQSLAILKRFRVDDPLTSLQPVCPAAALTEAAKAVRQVRISDEVLDYLLRLTGQTRQDDAILLGASPRAELALSLGARALAAIRGRDFVVPDDIRDMAIPVLAHRLVLKSTSVGQSRSARDAVAAILEREPVPVENWSRQN